MIYLVRDNTTELHRVEADKFTTTGEAVVFHKNGDSQVDMEFVAYFFEPVSVVKDET